MTSGKSNDAELQRLEQEINKTYTPGSPIKDPRLFSGRGDLLNRCRASLGVNGMAFVIYGERGVGKTSFGRVLFDGRKAHWSDASKHSDFISIFLRALRTVDADFAQAERSSVTRASVGVDKVIKVSEEKEVAGSERPVAEQRLDLNFVLDGLHEHERELGTIVIDEFQRIENPVIHHQVIEVVKGLSDRGANVTVALLGVAESDRELIRSDEYPHYLQRHITPVQLPRMTEGELEDIFERRKGRPTFKEETRHDIVRISSGYPDIAHQLAQRAAMSWLVRSFTNSIKRRLADSWFRKLFSERQLQLSDVGGSVTESDLDFATRTHVLGYSAGHPAATEQYREAGASEEAMNVIDAFANADFDAVRYAAVAEAAQMDEAWVRELITQNCFELFKDQDSDGFSACIPRLRPYLRAQQHLGRTAATVS